MNCFAGCSIERIADSLDLQLSELFPPRERGGREPKRIARVLTAEQALRKWGDKAPKLVRTAMEGKTPQSDTEFEFVHVIERNPAMTAGTMVSTEGERKTHPSIGPIEYEWRGCTMRRASAPHGLWHFEKAAACARDLTGEARSRFDALASRTGGERVMAIRLARPMLRQDYVLVVGEPGEDLCKRSKSS
jgi:hypothetical protein